MGKEKYTIREIQDIITPIAKKYSVNEIYLFGSYAKETANENSDIDIRVNTENMKGLFSLCGFYDEMEKSFDVPVDIISTRNMGKDFLDEISGSEVLIYDK